MEWKPLQAMVNGLDINEFVSDELLDKLRKEFKDKKVDIVTLQVAVRDKPKEFSTNFDQLDLISLYNHNVEDTLLHKTVVDVTHEENLEKIKRVIEDLYRKKGV